MYNEFNNTITVNFTGSYSGDLTVPFTLDASSNDVSADSRIQHQISLGSNSYTAAYKTYNRETPVLDGTTTDSHTVYSGDVVTFDAGSSQNTVITIWKPDGDNSWTQVDRFSTAPGTAVNYNTSKLDGKYRVTYNDKEPAGDPGTALQNSETSLTVNPLNLEASAQENNLTTEEAIAVDVSSADFGGSFTAELYEEGADFDDDNPVDTISSTFDGTGDATVTFGNISSYDDQNAGDYVVRVVHGETSVTAKTDTINVTEAGDAQVSFNNTNTVYQERGDIAKFTVNLKNTDDAYVEVGGDSSNFLANFSVSDGSDDDKSVTVYVNTNETNGAATVGKFISVSDSDSFSVANNDGSSGANEHGEQGVYTGKSLTPVGHANGAALSSPMATGSYNLILGTSDAQRDAKKILSVSQPSVDSLNTWVYAGSSLPDSDELNELVNGVSQSDTIAAGDTVVVEAQVSGIHGYINNSIQKTAYGYGDDSAQNSFVYLNVTETNTGPNTVANTIYAGAADSTWYDAKNNTVYYAFKTGSDATLSSDTAYKADLKVKKSNNVFKNTQNASATFSVEDQTMEITGLNSSDVLEVEAGENATVSGETNLAPGTSVSVEVETEGQLFTTSTKVTKNGTFSATFDLSQFDAGTSLTRVYAAGGSTSDEVTDAVLVEAAQQTTTTTSGGETTTESTTTESTTTTTTTTEETTTETTTEETTTVETTTGDNTGSIPGFGMAVSLVALVAAALLALRRSN
ncbi:BGTF surface domain-containing protein [Halorussus sp. AFM4]|uniref:BGTF surface domain-containing protein n=1 Tax=Halorussus sp. AFM4 TaxID=3421651 RepID=UPI003EB933BF